MQKIVFPFISILLLSVLFSCNKLRTEDMNLLTSHDWRMVQAFYQNVDSFPLYPTCRKDNVLSFQKDNSYTLGDGATSCPANVYNLLETGTWEVSKSLSLVVKNAKGVSTSFNILTLTEDSLRISPIVLNNGEQWVYIKN